MEQAVAALSGGLRGLMALAVVLGLALLLAWGLRRAGLLRAAGSGGRLAVAEALMLDSRTRLVLIRRDTREPLLAIGANGATLIESLEPPTAGSEEV